MANRSLETEKERLVRSSSRTVGSGGVRPPVEAATRMPLRRGQRILIDLDAADHVFFVDSGCLIAETVVEGDRRTVMQLIYPGDAVSRRAFPPMASLNLTAAMPSQVDRVPAEEAMKGPSLLTLTEASARLLARAHLHAVVIGRLSGEERLATLMLELALALGQETAGGISFQLPLSRADMADYLALNPDTLSRLLSRMRAKNLIAVPTRSRTIIKNLSGVAAITPLAAALRDLDTRDMKGGTAPWKQRF